MLVAPSILSADFGHLARDVAAICEGGCDLVHVDVMDGHFVPNISFGPFIVAACRRATKAFLDVHLMISEPDQYLEPFSDAGADSLTVHAETVKELGDTIAAIHALGLKAGVALNPETPVESLEEVMDQLDLVLVMTVNPGFAGQSFIPTTLQKVTQVRTMLDKRGSKAQLQVDGGINPDTARLAAEAGANVFVAASAIFQYPEGIAAGVDSLQEAISVFEG